MSAPFRHRAGRRRERLPKTPPAASRPVTRSRSSPRIRFRQGTVAPALTASSWPVSCCGCPADSTASCFASSAVCRSVSAAPEDQALLMKVPGMSADGIVLRELAGTRRRASDGGPAATEPYLREAVLDLVRARAAHDRDVARARAQLGASKEPPLRSAL